MGVYSVLDLNTTQADFTLQLIFAILRPKFRQIYGLREWFVSEEYVFFMYLLLQF